MGNLSSNTIERGGKAFPNLPEKGALWLSLAGCVLLLAATTVAAMQISYWRHDSFLYIDKAMALAKVREEGRWLNYLLFDVMRTLPAHLAWILNIICIGTGLWIIVRSLGLSRLASGALAGAILLYPGLYEQNTWPVSILPGCVIFLVAVLTIRATGWWIAPLFGILLFATIPYFYFLLPLLFLSGYTATTWRAAAFMSLKGAVWGLGLVAGYLVAAVFNQQAFGIFGIELAGWRQPQPAHDAASLLANLHRNAIAFIASAFLWLPTAGVLAFMASLLFAAEGRLRRADLSPRDLVLVAFASVVMLAPFLVVIPSGILVQARSLLPMAAGLLALPVLLAPETRRNLIVAVLCLFIGLPTGWQALQGTRWYAAFTQVNMAYVRAALPADARSYEWIFIDVPDAAAYGADVQASLPGGLRQMYYQEGLTAPDRLITPFGALGARQIVPCQYWPHETCEKIRRLVDETGTCSQTGPGTVCAVGVDGNNLLVSFRP